MATLTAASGIDDLLDPAAERPYRLVHLGESDRTLGEVFDVVRGAGARPPRTGHLGDWTRIGAAAAGAPDVNEAICRRDLGHPSVCAFTRTESPGGGGDAVYRPGTTQHAGESSPLPLRTWDGRRFRLRDRSRPWFCPLVLTEHDGERAPLVEVQWRTVDRLGWRARLEADLVWRNWDVLGRELEHLVTRALGTGTRACADVVGHAVTPDGRMHRGRLELDGTRPVLNGHVFASVPDLVDAAALPFRLVCEPRDALSRVRDLPPVLPLVSHLLLTAWTATLDPAPSSRPAHLHWAARSMAGYPPRVRGYMVERSTTRSMRRLCDRIGEVRPGFDGLDLVLLPAAVFLLCPADRHPSDVRMLADLVDRVVSGRAGPDGIDDLTRRWAARHRHRLSAGFRSRFGASRPPDGPPTPARSREPENFRRLTFREACAVVGALHDALRSPG